MGYTVYRRAFTAFYSRLGESPRERGAGKSLPHGIFSLTQSVENVKKKRGRRFLTMRKHGVSTPKTLMNLNSIILAAEDRLSEAVATKILNTSGFDIVRTSSHRRGAFLKGKSHLKQIAPEFNRSAAGPNYFFMLTDLDSPQDCPPNLIQSWVRGPLHPRFFLRVAVMEVESWVMADRGAIAEFLGISLAQVPFRTDEILHPKEFLVSLARKSPSAKLRRELVPGRGKQSLNTGPGYNRCLSDFVRDSWNIERAAAVSPSLKRTVNRLRSATLTLS